MAASFQGFRSLIENSPDAISVIDAQGEILYGSSSTTRILGYRPEELLGRNCMDLIHPDDQGHSTQALREVLAKPPGPLKWDARVRRKDGNYFWVESTVSNLLEEIEVQAIVMHQRDINALKAAEVERQQHAEELARSNLRLEEFAHLAAHDLREPLRMISAYTQLLVRRTEMDGNATQIAELIVAGAERMSSLINDLLSFASTGKHEPPRSIDLQQAIAVAIANLAPAIQATDARVTVDRLPVVRGHENNVVRLFQNLLSNALAYRSERPIEIHVTAKPHGPVWLIGIKDNGLGIAAENHSLVFMPFTRLANPGVPGSGLGLTVCKRIVEEFGGAIWVESELGAGSTFFFTILAEMERMSVPMTYHATVV